MDGPFRWVVAILFTAAIIALVVFARGDAGARRADGAAFGRRSRWSER